MGLLARIQQFAREVVGRAASLVLDSPGPVFYGLSTLILLAKCGLGYYPALSNAMDVVFALPKAPEGYAPIDQWIMTSLDGPILARLLGIFTWQNYAVMHAVFVVIATVAIFVWVRLKFGSRAARLGYLALTLTSAPIFLLTWLGSYDPFTFALSSFLALTTGWLGTLVLALLLGFQHFEQGTFVCLALLLMMPQRYIKRPAVGASLIGGLVLGKGILTLYLRSIGVTGGRLDFALARGLGNSWQTQTPLIPIWAFAMLGGAWLWVAFIALRAERGSGYTWRALGALALLTIPMLLTYDQVRVYSIMSWPVVLLLTLHASKRASSEDVGMLAGIGFLALLVVPSVYVWGALPAPTFPVQAVPYGVLPWAACAIVAVVLMIVAPWDRRQLTSADQ